MKGFKAHFKEKAKMIFQTQVSFYKTFTEGNFHYIVIPYVSSIEEMKAIGRHTDIMKKEIYFAETKHSSKKEKVLIPEGTAQVLTHLKSLSSPNEKINVFYMCDCFRHESPQAGRLRQFKQLGCEMLNHSKREILHMLHTLDCFLSEVNKKITIKISIQPTEKQIENIRNEYKVFDLSNEQILIGVDKKIYKLATQEKCDLLNTIFTQVFNNINLDHSQMARGLSYYNGLIFEGFLDNQKNAVLGGGEYIIDGKKGVGFAIGLERFTF